MYSRKSGLLIGFHGCDKETCDKVINGKTQLAPSQNEYDWLGNGIYFWENNDRRAYQFSQELMANPRPGKPIVINPAIIRAVIDLGNCLDLLDSEYLALVKDSYKTLEFSYKAFGITMPSNKKGKETNDLLLRNLDCAVIENLHKDMLPNSFDSVRGVFWEGDDLYPKAGFKRKTIFKFAFGIPIVLKVIFFLKN